MIKIKELIEVEDIIEELKIHLAIGGGDDYYEPLKKFENDEFEEWQSWQTKKNFTKKYLASFITYDINLWMFAGVYEINDEPVYDENLNAYYYPNIKKTNRGEELIGRLIVQYEKNARQTYRHAEGVIEIMSLHSIAEEKVVSYDFPGYKNTSLKFNELRGYIDRQEKTWKTALSITKAIYAIVDSTDGKLYVGSAIGQNCLWGRWSEYIQTGHGGNKKLKALLKINGANHVENFIFTIIENFDSETPDNYVIERESYWKNAFLTRKFGNNEN
jgi:hypothetical protein